MDEACLEMKKRSISPKVSIIVLNYNGLNFLKECLPSIKTQSYSNIETIVVDNNSTDGSQNYIRRYRRIRLVQNPENLGYSKANNIAAETATGELLFFLNNDTQLFRDTIEKMVRCYEPKSLVAPAQIITANKGTDKRGASGSGMDIFGYSYVNVNSLKTKPFFVDGAAIFISKKDFRKIGKFDEELFIFHEDLDLSWRAQLFGYKLIRCWDAKLYHYSGGNVAGGSRVERGLYRASFFRLYLNQKNVIRNIIKNYSLLLCLIILPTLMFIHIVEMAILLLMGQIRAVGCYLTAYQWNILHLSDTLKKRAWVQKRRKISDLVLLSKIYLAYSKLTALYRLGPPKFM